MGEKTTTSKLFLHCRIYTWWMPACYVANKLPHRVCVLFCFGFRMLKASGFTLWAYVWRLSIWGQKVWRKPFCNQMPLLAGVGWPFALQFWWSFNTHLSLPCETCIDLFPVALLRTLQFLNHVLLKKKRKESYVAYYKFFFFGGVFVDTWWKRLLRHFIG